jgi:hypothetical protein
MTRDRIIEALKDATVVCGCDEVGENREPVFWGDVASDAALKAITPIVESLIAEARKEWVAEALSDKAAMRAARDLFMVPMPDALHRAQMVAAIRAAIGGDA